MEGGGGVLSTSPLVKSFCSKILLYLLVLNVCLWLLLSDFLFSFFLSFSVGGGYCCCFVIVVVVVCMCVCV